MTASFPKERVFPALDIQKSGTRREDLLLDPEEQEAVSHHAKSIKRYEVGRSRREHPEYVLYIRKTIKNWYRWSKARNLYKIVAFIKIYGIIQTLFNRQFNCRDLQG